MATKKKKAAKKKKKYLDPKIVDVIKAMPRCETGHSFFRTFLGRPLKHWG